MKTTTKLTPETKIPIAETIIEYITDFCGAKNVAVLALDTCLALDKCISTTLLIMKRITPKELKELKAQKIDRDSEKQTWQIEIESKTQVESSIFKHNLNDYPQSDAAKSIGPWICAKGILQQYHRCRKHGCRSHSVRFDSHSDWGKKVPMINITEKEGTVRISYHEQLVLDFCDPRFLDYLELVLTHILEQDDLLQLFLPVENSSCSTHYSQDCEHDPL